MKITFICAGQRRKMAKHLNLMSEVRFVNPFASGKLKQEFPGVLSMSRQFVPLWGKKRV